MLRIVIKTTIVGPVKVFFKLELDIDIIIELWIPDVF